MLVPAIKVSLTNYFYLILREEDIRKHCEYSILLYSSSYYNEIYRGGALPSWMYVFLCICIL